MIPKTRRGKAESRHEAALYGNSTKSGKFRGDPKFTIDNVSKEDKIRAAREAEMRRVIEQISEAQGIAPFEVSREWAEIFLDYTKRNKVREDHMVVIINARYADYVMPKGLNPIIDELSSQSKFMLREREAIAQLHEELIVEEREAADFNNALENL